METGSGGGAPGSATNVQGAHAGTAAATLFLSSPSRHGVAAAARAWVDAVRATARAENGGTALFRFAFCR